jgi:FdrA protein
MTGAWNFVRRSFYQDSVTLMRLAADMEAVPGVRRAAAMMGTPQNLALLAEAGLLAAEGEAAGPTDLVVAVLADSREAAEGARAAALNALTSRRAAAAPGAGARPLTLASALRALPGATLALISVPGAYAGAEALKALSAGLHVMLFSDNVPVATEIELKQLARERALFLMGPDCGTAIVNGAPLGFANAVPRGRIGIAAASGTGLQEVACQIAAAGEGISHAIGVGGRDLADEVGGLMMERALAVLAVDPGTDVVCVIGKPPGVATLKKLQGWIAKLGKPCVAQFRGAPHVAATLEDAALAAVALARGGKPAPVEFTAPPDTIARIVEDAVLPLRHNQRWVRGVYAGGTLAYEAVGILKARLAGVAPGVTGGGKGHRVVDLGEDRFTVGRPHPMIDGTVRREWIEKDGADPETAVLLLDVVLGYGAHSDPAGEVLPAIRAARRAAESAGRHLAVVASVCGTEGDPQRRSAQVATLSDAGVIVMPSNAQAARLAALIAARRA